MKAVGHGKATDVYKIVMMGHVMTDITLNIGKTMLPDGVHGEATKRTLSRYDGVVRGHLWGIYAGMVFANRRLQHGGT